MSDTYLHLSGYSALMPLQKIYILYSWEIKGEKLGSDFLETLVNLSEVSSLYEDYRACCKRVYSSLAASETTIAFGEA